jgi:hypothetical protein
VAKKKATKKVTKKRAPKRKRKNPGKGSAFERKICKELSLWWSDGKRDDVFWRTAGSGSRATVRAKTNQTTHNSHGDIGAVDPFGAALVDVFVFSLKNGYKDTHASGLLDKPRLDKKYELEKWIEEISNCCEKAGTVSWVIIHGRKGRAITVYVPEWIANTLDIRPENYLKIVKVVKPGNTLVSTYNILIMRWEDFLKCTPKRVVDLSC